MIFDEVQLCERALTALKYFCEQAPEYHVIACGGLLGVAVNRKQFSFPVGKVDMKTLYPMDMEEFLLACGKLSWWSGSRIALLITPPCPPPSTKPQ